MAQFGIQHLSARYPQDLSPGEKQRVALARALAARPDLFLFDEPFSSLDARTRDALRDELKAFLRKSGVPAIFVSHDRTDAALLADRVAVLNRGEIQQVGTMQDIFRRPATAFVAEFTGMENILAGQVLAKDGELWRVRVADRILHVKGDDLVRADVLLCIRAEEVGLRVIDGAGPLGLHAGANRLSGRVADATSIGVISRVTVDCGFSLVAYVTSREHTRARPFTRPGDRRRDRGQFHSFPEAGRGGPRRRFGRASKHRTCSDSTALAVGGQRSCLRRRLSPGECIRRERPTPARECLWRAKQTDSVGRAIRSTAGSR